MDVGLDAKVHGWTAGIGGVYGCKVNQSSQNILLRTMELIFMDIEDYTLEM